MYFKKSMLHVSASGIVECFSFFLLLLFCGVMNVHAQNGEASELYPRSNITDKSSDGIGQKMMKDSKTPRYEGGAYATASYEVVGRYGYGFGIATTHGCLINPYLYIGGGAGLNFMPGYTSLTIFADFRGYFIKGHLKPYADLKLGYDVSLNGVYLYPAVGLRYKYLDFSAGFELQRATMVRYNSFYGGDEYFNTFIGSLAFKLGVRF